MAHQTSEGEHRCAQVGRLGSRNTRCFCPSHTRGYYAPFSDEEAEVQTGQVPAAGSGIRTWPGLGSPRHSPGSGRTRVRARPSATF